MPRDFSLKKSLVIFLLGSLLFTAKSASSATPTFINYQGYITNSSGVAQSGTANVIVRLYDAPTGGTLLFEENEGSVTISNGYFSIPIGSVGDVNGSTAAAALTDLPFDQTYYVTVELGSPYSTGEMTLPGGVRSKIGVVPFALTSYGALTSPTSSGLLTSKGKMYFDTTDNQLYVYDGTSWKALGIAGAGITTLNGLSGVSQTFAIGAAGNDINISSIGSTHTFNIPNAGISSRGVISTTTQTIAGDKTFTGSTTLATTTSSNLFANLFNAVTGTVTGLTASNATTSNLFASALNAFTGIFSSVTGGSITATSSLVSNGTLTVTGTTTLATTSVSSLTSTNATTTNLSVTNLSTSNSLSASGNTLTSNVGGSVGTSTIITSNTASSSANLFQTIVNGVSSTLANIINSFTQGITGNTLTTTINGLTSTSSVITSNSLSTSGATLTTTINGVATSTDLTNLVASSTSNNLTISTSTNSFVLTSIVNGKTATTTANFVNGNSLASAANTLTSIVNGLSTSTSIINSSSVGANTGVVTVTVNGITATTSALNLFTFLASSTNQNLTLATTTNGQVTYTFTDNPTFTNATTTNLFTSVLNAVTGVISSLTGGSITGGSITATSSLTSNGTLTVTGQSTLGNASTTNLTVSGQTYLANASSSALTANTLYGALVGSTGSFSSTLNVTGNTTLANASATALTVSGQTTLGLASSTGLTAGTLYFSNASSTGGLTLASLYGASLSNCNNSTEKLMWADGTFYCGTDAGGAGGSITSLNGSTVASQTFATSTTGGLSLVISTNTGTGVHTFTLGTASGYTIPLTASTSQWSGFFNTPISYLTAGTNILLSGTSTIAVSATPTFTSVNTTGDGTIGGALSVTGTSTLATTSITSLSITGQTTLGNASSTGGITANAFYGTLYGSLTGATNINSTNASTSNFTNSNNTYLSALTKGSIPFIGQGGLLSQDNSNLYYEASTSRLGIGTTTPTATLSLVGNMHISGDIIPDKDNTYYLGSPTNMWHSVYIGPGSLYVNGQKVLQTDVSDNVVVSADINQNLIQKTSGTGNIELNPSGGGQVLLKGDTILSAGKTFRMSNSSAVTFTDGVSAGNIGITGNLIQSTNLNGGISLAATGTGGVYVTNGNFGIGTTSPGSKLTVQGDAYLTGTLNVATTSLSNLSVSGPTFLTGLLSLGNASSTGGITANTFFGNLIGSSAQVATLNVSGQTTLANASSTNQSLSGNLYVTGQSSLATASATALTANTLYGALVGSTGSFSSTLNVTGNTTLANASATALTVSGQTTLGLASSTGLTAGTLYFSNASSTGGLTLASLYGASLSNCNNSTEKLMWADGTFYCGTDAGGAGGSITSLNGSTVASQTFATSTTGGLSLVISTNTGTGVHTFTLGTASGYTIPLTASTSQWSGFFNTPISYLTAGTNILLSGTSTIAVSATPSFTSVTTTDLAATNATATTLSVTNLSTSNSLSASGNTLTSNIGGSVGTSTIITSNTASSSANLFQTIVNGVSSTLANIINSFTQGITGNTLTTTINGLTSTSSVITSNSLSTSGATLTTTINGVATSTDLTNLVASSTSNNLTISTSTNSFVLTSIVNGKTATTTANFVNGNSLASAANTLTSIINGLSTSTSIINSSSVAANTGVVTVTINGITATTSALNLFTFLASSTNQNLTLATTTNGQITYTFTDNPVFTNATTTNLFTSVLNAVTGAISSLTSSSIAGGSITATSSLTSNGTLTVTGQSALGNASTTNLSVSGQTYLGNAFLTGLLNLGNASSTGGITAVNLYATNLNLTGSLRDSTNASGTQGQVLLSTGTSTQWVATSSLGIGSSITGGIAGYLARWTSPSNLSTGLLLDDGTVSGVNATSSSYTFNVQGSAGTNPFNVATSSGASLFTVLANGNVGIGTTSPVTALAVNGTTTSTGGFIYSQNRGLRFDGGQVSLVSDNNALPLTITDNSVSGSGIIINSTNYITRVQNWNFSNTGLVYGLSGPLRIGVDTNNSVSDVTFGSGVAASDVGAGTTALGTVYLRGYTARNTSSGAGITGGPVSIVGGSGSFNATGTATGGSVSLTGGTGFGSGNGGNIILNGGNATGTGVYGNVLLAATGGNVGIGTTSPGSLLSVQGNTYIGGNITGTGTLSIAGQSSLANASTTALSVSGPTFLTGLLNLGNASSTGGITATTFFGNLIGSATLSSLTVTGQTTLGNASTTNQSISGNLYVTGQTSLGNASTTGITSSGTLNVTGRTTLTNSSSTNESISGNLYLSGLTQGSVPFIGANGLISQNNANFFWDNANGRLGIGTTTPAGKATIIGTSGSTANLLTLASSTGTTILSVTSDGNLNVGGSQDKGYINLLAGGTNSNAVSAIKINNTDFLTAANAPWEQYHITPLGSAGQNSTVSPAPLYFDNGFYIGTGRGHPTITPGSNVGSFAYDLKIFGGTGSDVYGQAPGGNVYINGGYGLLGGAAGNVILAYTGTTSQGMVGIGTSTPTSVLTVASSTATGNASLLSVGTSTTIFNVLANGNVGIGSTIPAYKLAVTDKNANGDTLFVQNTNASGSSEFTLANASSSISASFGIGNSLYGAPYADAAYLWTNPGSDFKIINNATVNAIFKASGNVGMGTTTPTSLLTVASSTATGASSLLSVGTSTTLFSVLANNTINIGSKVSFDTTGALVSSQSDGSKYIIKDADGSNYIKSGGLARFSTLGIGMDSASNNGVDISWNGNTSQVAYGVRASSTNTGGTAGVGGFYTVRTLTNGNAYSNAYGVNVDTLSLTGGATVNNNYGVYIANGTAGTNHYGLYQTDAGNSNYFAGNIGVGTTSPIAALAVKAAPSSTASLLTLASSSDAKMFDIANSGAATISVDGALTTSFLTLKTTSGTNYWQFTSSSELCNPSGGGGVGCSLNYQGGLFTINTSTNATGTEIKTASGKDLLITSGNDLVFKTNNSNAAVIKASGNFGIGTSTPTSLLTIASSTATGASSLLSVGTSTTLFSVLANNTINIGSKVSFDTTGALVSSQSDSSKYIIKDSDGSNYIKSGGNARVGALGVFTDPNTSNAITISKPIGSFAIVYGVSASTTNTDCTGGCGTSGVGGFYTTRSLSGSNTYTNAYGLNVDTLSLLAGAAVTNNYGVYIANGTAGTNHFGLYQADTGNSNYLAGNVGIGTSTPGSKLSVIGDAYIAGNLTATGSLTLAGNIDTSGVINAAQFQSGGISNGNDFIKPSRYAQWNVYETDTQGFRVTTSLGSVASSGVKTYFALLPSYNQTSGTTSNTDLFINRTETAVGSGSQYLIDAEVNNNSKFNLTNTGQAYFAGNVGIGTSTPGSKLSVQGNTYIGGNITGTGTLSVAGQSSLVNASTTALSVSGPTFLTGLLNLGNASSTGGITAANLYATNLSLTGSLRDSTNASGTLGQVLLSTGTSTRWVATSSLGLTGTLSGTGITGYLTRWTGASTLSTGLLLDNGSVAGVNATSSSYSFNVQGSAGTNPLNVASSTGSSLLTVLANGNVGIGFSGPTSKLAINGDTYVAGNITATGTYYGVASAFLGYQGGSSDYSLGIGTLRTGDGYSYIDLVGDTTYTDYGARFVRPPGANSNTEILHRGTGFLRLNAQDAASVQFATNNVTRVVIDSSGNVGIGTSTPTTSLDILTGSSVGAKAIKILAGSVASADLATIEAIGRRSDANTSGTFSGTLALAKNRTDAAIATSSVLGRVVFGGNHTDGSLSNILYGSSIVGISDGAFVSSTSMPSALAFYTGTSGTSTSIANTTIGTERLRISSSGNIGIGSSSPVATLAVVGSAGTNPLIISSSTGASLLTIDQTGRLTYTNASSTNQSLSGNLYVTGQSSLANASATALSISGNTFLTGLLNLGNASSTSGITASNFYGALVGTTGTFSSTLNVTGQTTLSNASTTGLTVSSGLTLNGWLRDSTNATGTLGQVLLSTGTSTQWVATSSLGISSSLSGGIAGYLARWTSPSNLSTGVLLDNGTVSGVNATSSSYTFNVQGSSGVNPFNVASSSGASLFAIDTAGKLTFTNASSTNQSISSNFYVAGQTTLGTTTISKLTVTPTNPELLATVSTGLSAAYRVVVQGRYAYIIDQTNGLVVYDVSDPSAPKKISTSTTSPLTSPNQLAVSGRYAYVGSTGSSTIQVYDISNPLVPIKKGAVSLGANTLRGLQAPGGRYVYVSTYDNYDFHIIDVSDPDYPIQVSQIAPLQQNGGNAAGLYVQGRYAYGQNVNTLWIVDVTNPVAPVQVASGTPFSSGTGNNITRMPYISGRYGYFLDGANGLRIFDVSNPTSPVSMSAISSTMSGSLGNVWVSGGYAYVADSSNGLFVFDVASSTNPTKVGQKTGGITYVTVSGKYAYAVNGASSFTVYDLGGGDINALTAHSLETGNLSVRNDIITQGMLSIGGGLSIANGGFISQGNSSVFGSFTIGTSTYPLFLADAGNSRINIGTSTGQATLFVQGTSTANPFIVASSTGESLFTILANGNVGIGSSTPAANFGVNGDAYFGGNVTATGTLILGSGEGGVPIAATIRGPAAGGSNIAGANLTFDASNGTGLGGSGALVFRTAPQGSYGPVTLDATSTFSTTTPSTANSLSWSHTITSAGSSRMLLVTVTYNNTVTANVASVQYAGVPLTLLGSKTDGTYIMSFFYLLDPPTGTNQITLNVNQSFSNEALYAAGESYIGVNQATPFGVLAGANGNNATTTVSASSTAGDIVSGMALKNFGGAALTPSGGMTRMYSFSVPAGLKVEGANITATTTTTTMTWTSTSTQSWLAAAVDIKTDTLVTSTASNTLTERLRITPSGRIGIGTSNPLAALQVGGDIRIGTSGTNGCLQGNGGATLTGTCSSDERLKAGVVDIPQVLQKFANLRAINFKWNEDAGRIYGNDTGAIQTGYLAQNVEALFPELVSVNKEGYKQVNYSAMNIYTAEAVKELSAANLQASSTIYSLTTILSDATSSLAALKATVEDNKQAASTTFSNISTLIDTNKTIFETEISSRLTKDDVPKILGENGVTILSNGKMGIGTTTPEAIVDIYNTSTTTSDIFRIISNANDSHSEFTINAKGDIFITGQVKISKSVSLAELYDTDDSLIDGDIVTFATTTSGTMKVRKARAHDIAEGVVMYNSALTFGETESVPVATFGTVSVRVTSENGIVHQGDLVTVSSSTSGYAMKLTESGAALGKALTEATDGTSTILITLTKKYEFASLRGVTGLGELASTTATFTEASSTVTQDITDSLNRGGSVVKEYFSVKMKAVAGYFDKLFAKEIYTDTLCVKKSNGTDVCLTGDQVESVLNATQVPLLTPNTPTPSGEVAGTSTTAASSTYVTATSTDVTATTTDTTTTATDTTSTTATTTDTSSTTTTESPTPLLDPTPDATTTP